MFVVLRCLHRIVIRNFLRLALSNHNQHSWNAFHQKPELHDSYLQLHPLVKDRFDRHPFVRRGIVAAVLAVAIFAQKRVTKGQNDQFFRKHFATGLSFAVALDDNLQSGLGRHGGVRLVRFVVTSHYRCCRRLVFQYKKSEATIDAALFFGFLSLLLITFIVLICVGMTKVMAKALNADELYLLIGLVVFVFGG